MICRKRKPGSGSGNLLIIDMEVKKGKIHSLEEGGKKARCVPSDNSEIVTLPLVIPYYWRQEMGNLQAGQEIYYFEDESKDGYIIGRTDGEWDYTLRGNLTVTEDVTASGKSLRDHTHRESQGGTTNPPL